MRNHLLLILVTILAVCFSDLKAQVTIAPTNLFIDSNTRFGTYMVVNGSNSNQEVSIDFFFGYTGNDDEGNRVLVDSDSIAALNHSVAENVRAFPRNFTLSPGQRQIVRLRVNLDNDVPDGTYWARIRTSSTQESPPVEIQDNTNVAASVGITVEQVTGLYFKKGEVNTGIEISNMTAERESNNLIVKADLLRTGNSPFLGSITTTVYDQNNSVVTNSVTSTTIFFDGIFKRSLDITGLNPGNYRIEMKFETSRSDVSGTDIIQMPTVTNSIPFNLR